MQVKFTLLLSTRNKLIPIAHFGLIFLYVSILYHSGCAIPEENIASVDRSSVSPKINFVPSIRTRQAPPILGVRYVKTIGRTGQGAGELLIPMGITIDAYGQLYVADTGNNRIQVMDGDGNFIAEFGNYGWREGEFDYPTDVALSLDTLYVADTGNNRIQYCNLVNTIFYPLMTPSEDLQFDAPEGVSIGRNGDVYVVDTNNHRWLQFSRSNLLISSMGSFGVSREQFWNPTDLVVDSHGTVYIVDTGNNRIRSYDFSGNPIHTWGQEGSELGHFREPKRITLDDWNYLYITDSGNRRIQISTTEGTTIIEFTCKTLLNPCGIAVSDKGYVYVSDTDAGDIKIFHVIFQTKLPSNAAELK